MPKDSALPIVLCADESYIKYASVVMISVLKATKARVRFYLLSDGALSKASLDKLSYIESTYPNASISHSCHSLARFVSLPTQGENNSHITYLRLLLDSILPQSVSKCVYLDCDVLVCADIAGLFSYGLHGALLGAVRDLAFNDASSACRNHLGFYFNAGVLLLDMEKWRESKASERLFHLIATRPEITQGFHDQNLLNECFCDEVCELPFGWNVIVAPPHTLRFADKDSVLGSHSADLVDFGTTADHKSSSAPKSTKNYESNTANPRILEEDKQNALESSSRADEVGVAIHSPNTQNLESSMDCHDLPSKSRNDRKNAQALNEPAKDSRNFNKNAQNVFSQNATRRQDLGDKNGALQGESRAHTWAYVTADSPQQSPFLAPKPTPKPIKAQSTNQKPAFLCRHSRATYESALESPYIVHFAAQPKPWGRVCYIKQTHSTLELIEYANPHTKQWWEVARKSPFFTEILRAFIAPTLQAYKTKAIFAAKTKAPRIYAALHALARLFTHSNPSHKEA
ncbi:glycosyltransferase family 8 protein [Helicobacter canis]|uniref:Glycosyl transferase family 8 C-terminal domain-containing protein n=1 Tax=Helicobacter canis NCTC 12740 TaxID=1357399 RepID=V8CLQ9_9HELI|nr:glycosyltransferase family 8 protein [Helicobacter canis]ETD27691.1 hypothetical protein HMPREF2087_00611 [Helicobacter canis NCTC 12740]